MWRPPLNFVTLHYSWIIFCAILAIPIFYGERDVSAINAVHFGSSASTESGLNTVDVMALKTYQQLYLYFIPIVTNLGFINIMVVVVRLWWFRKHLKKLAPALYEAKRQTRDASRADPEVSGNASQPAEAQNTSGPSIEVGTTPEIRNAPLPKKNLQGADKDATSSRPHIKFDESDKTKNNEDDALYVPGPRARDQGHPLMDINSKHSASDDESDDDREDGHAGPSSKPGATMRRRRGLPDALSLSRAGSVASSVFVIGVDKTRSRRLSTMSQPPEQPAMNEMPFLSKQATIGRNSQFHNLTQEDIEALGGIEYRSLRLLLKIVLSYFFGMHLLGVICLVPWILRADQKYKDYLAECGQGQVWWAFYSAQTMVDNLGFTLTPDSMIQFRDAEWPMFIMSFLAFAGNTFYPIFLRLTIWTMSKILPKTSTMQDPLRFLLDHPRRCYTLLFPAKATWVLFFILFALNFIDTLLIIVLDLHNPEVASLPGGQRVLAAIFQAASSRHTGTSTFGLSNVNPAVQFSLLVMMYISIFPIAISIRASNTYEEKTLGIYDTARDLEGQASSSSYLLSHIQNQLSFDLWYIFLGIFIIAISESSRIMDAEEPAMNLFAIFFECTSAYGNVGLSLGYPGVNVSLCGKFNTFSKFIICVLMIRGRHRGLPYQLDRAIMLPDEHLIAGSAPTTESSGDEEAARS